MGALARIYALLKYVQRYVIYKGVEWSDIYEVSGKRCRTKYIRAITLVLFLNWLSRWLADISRCGHQRRHLRWMHHSWEESSHVAS